MIAAAPNPGVLVLVVGNSGVGKDTLIRGAQTELANDARFAFPTRCITRPVDPNEDHAPVNDVRFLELLQRGAFALHWSAHGLRYGVPASIDRDLAARKVVVCNVSRTVVQAARDMYLRTAVIEITAPLPLRAARLTARNRETAAEVRARLAREVASAVVADYIVNNDTTQTEATKEFARILETIAQ